MKYKILFITFFSILGPLLHSQPSPDQIKFVRQGVQRMIFNVDQSIPMAKLEPGKIVGLSAMHPATHFSENQAEVSIIDDLLKVQSVNETNTAIWFGGFNPFATYSIDLESLNGSGAIGFLFSGDDQKEQMFIKIAFANAILTSVDLRVNNNGEAVVEQAIGVNEDQQVTLSGRIILQMLGSGFTLYHQDKGIPIVIGQSDFSSFIDLRRKHYIHSFQSNLFVHLQQGDVQIKKVEMGLSAGVGLADIRAITYENGDPLLDQGRLWYTMSIRGRALPHHIQGVFSMNPTVFDLKLEGVILFDRNDGILRNEVASHIFYDRSDHIWRGLTTGFSAYANPEKEKKQLLAIESSRDPRFGFSVMEATPFGMVGDIEDPHILFDSLAGKWRMLTCENQGGYKAIVLESDNWNKGYKKISGPVSHNSTGTSIQKVGDQLFCFSGSSERKVFVYTYPDLDELGSITMDLPPWDEESGTRVWPNIVQLPKGYPFRYVALMMDRYNYPGLQGPNWSYGALYLYHGYE